VIYTHSLDPHIAVVRSGLWNFPGRSIGFVMSEKFREIEGEDAEIIPRRVLVLVVRISELRGHDIFSLDNSLFLRLYCRR
jgi:hypothetical protein